jgi:hypothetical protein
MERFPKTAQEAEKLIQLADLLKDAAQTVIEEWKKEDFTNAPSSDNLFTKDTATVLPGWELHQAQRTILAATGAITELVVEPYARVQEVACQFFEARALFIASERRIADLLADAGPNGLTVTELSEKTTIEKGKLGKIHLGAGLSRKTNRADFVSSESRSSDNALLVFGSYIPRNRERAIRQQPDIGGIGQERATARLRSSLVSTTAWTT